MIYIILLAAGVLSLCAFLNERAAKASVEALALKALTSFFFIALACIAIFGKYDGGFRFGTVPDRFKMIYGVTVVLGLVCGLMGDIWLDLKWVYPDDNAKYLYLGFGSFAAGHVFFIFALRFFYRPPAYIYLTALIAAAVLCLPILFCEKKMKLKYGKFKTASALYGFVLFFVTAFACAIAVRRGIGLNTASVFACGGVLFSLSDLVLSNSYFGENKNTPPYVISNHVLYYAAQFLIASSVLFV